MQILAGFLTTLLLFPSLLFAGDCNENGQDDAVDIATGTAVDIDSTVAALSAAGLSDLIADRFDFEGGDAGSSLEDTRMFDSRGNRLSTPLGLVPYTDGLVLDGDARFGSGSRYATIKQDGIFLLVVTDYDMASLTVSGALQAQAFADVTTSAREVWSNGFEYRMFTRSVVGQLAPSVHHLWLVRADDSDPNHIYSPNPQRDEDGLTQLGTGRVLIFALTAKQLGAPLSPEEFQVLCEAVLTQIATGSADCNGDVVPDECQLENDLNQNGTPDDCEPDCDASGLPDHYEVAEGLTADCDGDLVPDACQIAGGAADCNGNGVLDTCEVSQPVWRRSPLLGPIDAQNPVSYTFEDLPAADGMVSIILTHIRDTTTSPERQLSLSLNGTPISLVDQFATSSYCALDRAFLELPADVFNTLVPAGIAAFELVSANEPGTCDEPAVHLDLKFRSPGALVDCDQDGTPDACQLETGPDCDGNGTPDVCQVRRPIVLPEDRGMRARWEIPDLAANSGPVILSVTASGSLGRPADSLQVFLNGFEIGQLFDDGNTESCGEQTGEIVLDADLFTGLAHHSNNRLEIWHTGSEYCFPRYIRPTLHYSRESVDCDADGIPDACQLTPESDANDNDVLDRCEPDCDGNQIPDQDDIASENAADCNGDGVPDGCQTGDPVLDVELAKAYLVQHAAEVSLLIPDQLELLSPFGSSLYGGGVLDNGSRLHADFTELRRSPDIVGFNPALGPEARYLTRRTDGWFAFVGVGLSLDRFRIEGGFIPEPNRVLQHNEYELGILGTRVRIFEQVSKGSGLPVVQELVVVPNPGPGLRYGYTLDTSEQDHHVQGLESGQSLLYMLWLRDAVEPLDLAQVRDILTAVLGGSMTVRGDCDNDGIADECQLTPELDLDGNGLLDRCEADCNGNGLPDAADVASGASSDCNDNGLPDECELADGSAADVDFDGVLDECQLDCNENQIPDTYEFELGGAADCNGNGIPDECDVPRQRNVQVSFPAETFFGSQPARIRWTTLPAASDVTIHLSSEQALVRGEVAFVVRLNGTTVGTIGFSGGSGCDARVGTLQVDRAFFNSLLPGDLAELEIVEPDFFWTVCPGSTLIVQVGYLQSTGSDDCNQDGIPDDCQFADGTLSDDNGNGRADACEPDCDRNGVADSIEIADGLAADCNGNGIPDVCDVGAYFLSETVTIADEPPALRQAFFSDLPAPATAGTLSLQSTGSLSSADLRVELDGQFLGVQSGRADCSPQISDYLVPFDVLVQVVGNGNATASVSATTAEGECPAGELTVQLHYATGFDTDCDQNGQLDVCDLDPNTDCDATGVLDVCETTPLELDLRLIRTRFDALALNLIHGLGLYEFTGGVSGTALIDDGAGTYLDPSNRLYTHTWDDIPYTGGEVVASDEIFGAGSSYVTRKRPAIFTLFAHGASVHEFGVLGRLNQHDAELDPVRLFTTVQGLEYTILTKRWTQMPFPAPHQIYVVPGTWAFEGSSSGVALTSSSSDSSRIAGPELHTISDLLFLLVLTESGRGLEDEEIIGIVNETLAAVIDSDFDCDDDGVVDACQIDSDPSLDINLNGLLDNCEPDCNGNLIPDTVETADGTSPDCDGNGVPDECQPDCDQDGVIDRCVFLEGGLDCNRNSIPDACEPDCNLNGISDDCEIGVTETDCNLNGVPDSCEIAADPGIDCNGNDVPDTCDVPQIFDVGRLGPLDRNEAVAATLENLPGATHPVTVTLVARVNANAPARVVEFAINGVFVADFFEGFAESCTLPQVDSIELQPEEFNTLVPAGTAEITLIPRGEQGCNDGWAELTFYFNAQAFSPDCNGNQVPDECDLVQGLDFNNNGVVDDCGDCLGDTNGNGRVGLQDLEDVLVNFGTLTGATIETGDVDGDGDVDLADLAFVLSIFGQEC